MKLRENYRIKDINDNLQKLVIPHNASAICNNNLVIFNILNNLKELNKEDISKKYKLKVSLVRREDK